MTFYEKLMTSALDELDKKWNRLLSEGRFKEAGATLKTIEKILKKNGGEDHESV